MGTRSYICVKLSAKEKEIFNTEKDYVGVYCGLNGMVIGGVGETLLHYYNSQFKALRLIKHGEMRYLGDYIKDTQFLKIKNPFVFFNKEEIDKTFGFMIAYLYLCDENGWSYYRQCGRAYKWRNYGLIKDMAYFKKKRK